ncbi:hypothetical protein E0J21_35600 [Rhizobium laguerreae]|nr:hypothetical protein E0J21_35600 [Rhizobium laguerreae]
MVAQNRGTPCEPMLTSPRAVGGSAASLILMTGIVTRNVSKRVQPSHRRARKQRQNRRISRFPQSWKTRFQAIKQQPTNRLDVPKSAVSAVKLGE